MAWPAPSPGTPLEAEGDLRPREMTVHDGIRLKGLLGPSSFDRRIIAPAISREEAS